MVGPTDPIYPVKAESYTDLGLDLRTWMATHMMGARRARNTFMESAQAAKLAVQDADALIEELNK